MDKASHMNDTQTSMYVDTSAGSCMLDVSILEDCCILLYRTGVEVETERETDRETERQRECVREIERRKETNKATSQRQELRLAHK